MVGNSGGPREKPASHVGGVWRVDHIVVKHMRFAADWLKPAEPPPISADAFNDCKPQWNIWAVSQADTNTTVGLIKQMFLHNREQFLFYLLYFCLFVLLFPPFFSLSPFTVYWWLKFTTHAFSSAHSFIFPPLNHPNSSKQHYLHHNPAANTHKQKCLGL